MSLMAGKKVVILGVANERSIGYGILKSLKAQGATIALTYVNEAIEKKYLLDKLNFLESQFKKYSATQNSNIQSNTIENFNSNNNNIISEENNNINNNSNSNKLVYNTDIIDLIFLIIIGLIIIFIMNSIFTFGKSIGARNAM